MALSWIRLYSLLFIIFVLSACSAEDKNEVEYDLIIHNGLVYDGSGEAPKIMDVAVEDDKIVFIGDLDSDAKAAQALDANGLNVAPGFINVLSWATESLLIDGRSQGDIRQGVTLEVFGEGTSMGPVNAAMKEEMLRRQGDLKFDIPWSSFGGYMEHLESKGISTNVASFVGATSVRTYVLGFEDRAPDAEELAKMQQLVRTAMEEGALGVGSSLIYAPAFYADTAELITLMKAASEYGGSYISHMRSEGNQIETAINELITIAREASAPAQIYHLKMAGEANWGKLDTVIGMIEGAQAEGLKVTANMYTYTAGATGLDAMMPPWVQEGGFEAWSERLRDADIRARVAQEIKTASDDWENLYLAAGSADRVLLTGFKNADLKPLTGKTLQEIADMRGKDPVETAMDLVVEDGSRVGTAYFMMSEENVQRQIKLPWISFGSDAGSYTISEPFTLSNTHPRAYGNFARVIGKYVRDEKVIPMEEAIRKLTSLPADQLGIKNRGILKEGYFADIVIFDPDKVRDHATFDDPHQYSTGMIHVLVNGEQVLRDGEHTGAFPGRFVKGPGWKFAE
jgi:N-acyl-D-amino-acid deacylase